MMMMKYKGSGLVTVLLLATHVVLLNAAPPRIFGNKNNILLRGTTPASDVDEPVHDEEELELESLKNVGLQKKDSAMGIHSKNPVHLSNTDVLRAPTTVSTSTSSPHPVGLEYVKKPVNEEKPALSDNANSLKFSGEANPDGLRDLLFNTKKSHILQDGTSASSGKQLSRLNAHEHQFNNGMARQGDFLSAPVADNLSGGGRVGGSQGSITNNDDRLAQHISTPLNYKLDYTPQDIAEYIFWTRDERGVAMAIGDFLQEGLVGREDAVRFLEDVKKELNSIRTRYAASVSQGQQAYVDQHEDLSSPNGYLHSLGIGPLASSSGDMKLEDFLQQAKRDGIFSSPVGSPEVTGLSSGLYSDLMSSGNLPPLASLSGGGGPISLEELDYDVEKLRTLDAKMRESSLEEVIYQLAKDLFSESLKSSPSESIQKFSAFIESQAANGKIPKDLEKEVLEALVEALVDAVDERGIQLERQKLDQQHQQHGSLSSKISNELNVNSSPSPQPHQSHQASLLAGLKKSHQQTQ